MARRAAHPDATRAVVLAACAVAVEIVCLAAGWRTPARVAFATGAVLWVYAMTRLALDLLFPPPGEVPTDAHRP